MGSAGFLGGDRTRVARRRCRSKARVPRRPCGARHAGPGGGPCEARPGCVGRARVVVGPVRVCRMRIEWKSTRLARILGAYTLCGGMPGRAVQITTQDRETARLHPHQTCVPDKQ
jgi:hypothetical protein